MSTFRPHASSCATAASVVIRYATMGAILMFRSSSSLVTALVVDSGNFGRVNHLAPSRQHFCGVNLSFPTAAASGGGRGNFRKGGQSSAMTSTTALRANARRDALIDESMTSALFRIQRMTEATEVSPTTTGDDAVDRFFRSCRDASKVSDSTIANAGKGSFATRSLNKGDIFSLYPAHSLGVSWEGGDDSDDTGGGGATAAAVTLDDSDARYFRSPSRSDNYMLWLLGKRPLPDSKGGNLLLPAATTPGEIEARPHFFRGRESLETCPGRMVCTSNQRCFQTAFTVRR